MRLRPASVLVLLDSMALTGVPMAEAATVTSTFQVTANVQSVCTISTPPLTFGDYTGQTATAVTNMSVTCTNKANYTVGLNAGVGVGCSENLRCMTETGGTAKLEYSLYHDPAHTNVWTMTNVHNGKGNGSEQTIPIYGRARGEQLVSPAAYVDTITATLSF